MAAGSLKREIERKYREERHDQPDAKVGSGLRDRMTEDISETHPCPGPHEGARGAVADEPSDAQAARARQSGCDCGQLRQEGGRKRNDADVSEKKAARAAHQQTAIRSESSEHPEHSRAAPSTQAV